MRRPLLAILPLVLAFASGKAAAGLLAYYPFDSDFSDASGNNNHLTTAVGTPGITTAEGEFAAGVGALDLDSTTSNQEFLNLAGAITFGAGDAWSVAFWGRRRPGADYRQGMVIGNPGNSTDFIWIPDNPSQVRGLRFRSSSNTNADYGDFPDDGQWHHWVVIANGSGQVSAYRDKVPLGSISTTTSFSITSVGQAYNATTQSMNGQIDELHIYDEAIDPAKVEELFSASTGPDTTPPILAPGGIVDDQGGGPVVAGSVVTFTVSFNEDMEAASVDAGDFGNAGTAPISIGAVNETSPGVFSVAVTPTAPGSLQLMVVAGAVLTDVSGNALDTTAVTADDTIITVSNGTDPPPEVKLVRVFLLGGQSNADGRGDPAGLPTSPVNLQQAQDDVDYYYGSTLTTLRPLSQFGPEITLGRRLADSIGDGTGTRVAILKYGVGGTSLKTDWKAGGDATTSGDGPRYVSFQQVVGNGLAALAAAYPGAVIEIGGMVWVQGEKDARNLDHAEYQANLTDFIADVRATYVADLPFVVVRLSSGQTDLPAAGLDGVRAAQTAVAAADGRAPLVDTDGFGLQADALHFDALGQQQIGDASAGELLALLPFATAPVLGMQGNGDIEVAVDGAFRGFLYTLQTSLSLQPGDWADVGSVTATGPLVVFTFTPPPGETRRFFRVGRSSGP